MYFGCVRDYCPGRRKEEDAQQLRTILEKEVNRLKNKMEGKEERRILDVVLSIFYLRSSVLSNLLF